jgi:surface antigen
VKKDFDFRTVRNVGVVDVEGASASKAAKNWVTDQVNGELLDKGYWPVERAQLEALLDEQNLQASDITTPEGRAKASEILNVSAVVMVNIAERGDSTELTVKMVDVQDGSILYQGIGSASTERLLSTVAGVAVGAGTGVALGGNRAGRIVGGVAGGVLGGVAGNALSPSARTQFRKAIRQAVRDLPSVRD